MEAAVRTVCQRLQRMLFTSTSFGALVLLQSCQRTAHETSSGAEHRAFSYFEDATEKFGVRFVHDAGGAEKYFMPASVGSGLAFLDFNNDGRLDLFFVQNGGTESESRNALFRQESD